MFPASLRDVSTNTYPGVLKNIGTPKIISFTFGTNVKLMILGVSILLESNFIEQTEVDDFLRFNNYSFRM